jgi:hypothetical protein
MITQLRDVSATRQSAEMSVENQQEPASREVHKAVTPTPAFMKVKRERRFACQISHPDPLLLQSRDWTFGIMPDRHHPPPPRYIQIFKPDFPSAHMMLPIHST